MNKISKWIFSILVCMIMFFCGFLMSNKQTLQDSAEQNENSLENSEDEDLFPDLTKGEIKFLEDHLFGQWKFSERLFELDESENIIYDTTYNISDLGVDELKNYVVLDYRMDWIQFATPITQNTFTNAKDMFLFGENGGFLSTREPVYSIKKKNSDIIKLSNVYHFTSDCEIEFTGAKDFFRVTYYTQNKNGEYDQKKVGWDFGDVIYIDPDDKDTIYVDFCGLWKMKRDNKYYGLSGKSVH